MEIEGQEGFAGEGPYMKVWLKVADSMVSAARYETYGCPWARRCGNWMVSWIQGRTVEQVARLEVSDVDMMVGGLPLGKEHCATLAVKALRSALRHINVL